MAAESFFLGGILDPDTGERTGEPLGIDPADLTTHGVIVGMTGSGKTGLGVALIEEALLGGIPCLIIDPKGDMGNLALNFPELRPSDFRPWVDVTAVARAGDQPDQVAAATAERWSKGLESWGIGPDRMRQLRDAATITIFTPGSTAGVPIDVVGSLKAPAIGWQGNEEILRDEIEAFVSSLLTLAGIDADPVADPRHVLLATIVEHSWSRSAGLDLAALIGAVIDPPFRRLGVFDVDVFFPKKDRTTLAMRLNGLVASPSFAAWTTGPPLDVDLMLHDRDRPRAAVVSLSHLSEDERRFAVTLLLSKVVTWMRTQSGTGALRALVYMDEVFGYAPPTAEPPSKKPILTILKQARAFGVGMVLSTQNPVDLDYKAMANAGTWMVGRLQTERDKARVLEGVASATGAVDVGRIDDLVSGLAARSFVLHSTRSSEPRLFTTRWVMSYLAGPLTREQIAGLEPDRVVEPRPTPPADEDTSPVAPAVAPGIEVAWTSPSAPWVALVGGDPGSSRFAPAAVATVHLRYDDRSAGVDHTEVYEAVIHPFDRQAVVLTAVDHDDRDFVQDSPEGATYVLVGADISRPEVWKELATAIANRIAREQTVTIFANAELGLYSRVGETREAFTERCAFEAESRADGEVAALTDRYRARIRAAQDQLRRAEHRVRELEAEVGARSRVEMLSGAGDLLGALLGGRRGSSGLRRVASRRSQTVHAEERLDTAVDRLQMEQDDVVELEQDLAAEIETITTRWEAAAGAVDERAVPLERADVDVRPLRMAWIPV